MDDSFIRKRVNEASLRRGDRPWALSRVIYKLIMLSQYLKILKSHADDVYGIKARTTLSFYTVLSIMCVVVPTIFFVAVLLFKIF